MITLLRQLPEHEVLAHWAALYRSGKHAGYTDAAPDTHRGKSAIWVEVAISHALYNADWNAVDGDNLHPDKIARAKQYAASVGALPPGMAFYSGRGRTARAYVSDGNHRAHAAYLRGEPTARFYMPLPDYERFVAAHTRSEQMPVSTLNAFINWTAPRHPPVHKALIQPAGRAVAAELLRRSHIPQTWTKADAQKIKRRITKLLTAGGVSLHSSESTRVRGYRNHTFGMLIRVDDASASGYDAKPHDVAWSVRINPTGVPPMIDEIMLKTTTVLQGSGLRMIDGFVGEDPV